MEPPVERPETRRQNRRPDNSGHGIEWRHGLADLTAARFREPRSWAFPTRGSRFFSVAPFYPVCMKTANTAGRRARALRWTATPTTRRPVLLRSLPALPRLAPFTPCARLLAGSAAPNGRRPRPDRLRLAQGLHRSLTLLHLSRPLLRSLARSVRSLGRSLRSNVPRHRQPTPHPARARAGQGKQVSERSKFTGLFAPTRPGNPSKCDLLVGSCAGRWARSSAAVGDVALLRMRNAHDAAAVRDSPLADAQSRPLSTRASSMRSPAAAALLTASDQTLPSSSPSCNSRQ